MNMNRKTLRCRCPVCTAPMDLEYSMSYTGWERVNFLPSSCPKGHDIPDDLADVVYIIFDQRAADGVNDPDPRDVCGYTEAQQRAADEYDYTADDFNFDANRERGR